MTFLRLAFCVILIHGLTCEDYYEVYEYYEPPMTANAAPLYDMYDMIAISRDDLDDLYRSLLSSYDRRIRPLSDQSRTVVVDTLFVLTSIIEFETAEQRLTLQFYIRAGWRDEMINWYADSYGGTNFIKLPAKDIWTPQLKIVEEFDGRNYIGESTDITKISDEGDVQWVPEGMYSVVCQVDIQYYPYDEQFCTFIYYIAHEDNATVELDHSDDVPMDEFIENAAWKLVQTTRQVELKWGTYYVNIHLRLQRRAHFATFTIVTPLLMLAFLNIGVFLVPSGSGEKGTFAITVFLAYGIFITIVSDTLPHNSLQISFFVVFIIALLAVSAFSVLYSIIQAKLFATIGNKECKLRLRNPFSRNPTAGNKVEPDPFTFGGDADEGAMSETADGERYTWGMLLNKIDAIVCVVFFVGVSVATVAFFWFMLSHVAYDLNRA